jgi:hypothetical protein
VPQKGTKSTKQSFNFCAHLCLFVALFEWVSFWWLFVIVDGVQQGAND